ncbi:MAG: chromate transporter [Alkalispirochaeta sp.]
MIDLLKLALAFLKVGAFSFGGGYAALPLIEAEVVAASGWLSSERFADLISISQMTPGPVALNTATFIGFQIAGFIGALTATLSVVAAPTIIVFIIAAVSDRFFHTVWVRGALKGLKPALVALIAYSAYSLGRVALISPGHIVIAGGALVALSATRIHPALIVAAAGGVGLMAL